MSACERCWRDATIRAATGPQSTAEAYRLLVAERDCTPEQQAGSDAATCEQCGRKTLHQLTGECMAGCGAQQEQA